MPKTGSTRSKSRIRLPSLVFPDCLTTEVVFDLLLRKHNPILWAVLRVTNDFKTAYTVISLLEEVEYVGITLAEAVHTVDTCKKTLLDLRDCSGSFLSADAASTLVGELSSRCPTTHAQMIDTQLVEALVHISNFVDGLRVETYDELVNQAKESGSFDQKMQVTDRLLNETGIQWDLLRNLVLSPINPEVFK